MKTDSPHAVLTVAEGSGVAKPSFRQVLGVAAPAPAGQVPGLVKKAPMAVASSPSSIRGTARAMSLATAEVRGQTARVRVEAEAGRLQDVRSAHVVHAEQLVSARESITEEQSQSLAERAIDAITQELVSAFEGTPSRVANEHPRQPVSPPVELSSAQHKSMLEFRENHTKAVQTMALIERIEVFVKTAERPAIALTLNNSLGARVEIERVGPNEVALKLVGQRGPPTPDAVSRIREELRARGLKVAALSVA